MDFVRLFSLANGPWMALRFPNGSFGVLGTINHPSQGENSLVGCCLHTKKGDLLFVSCGGGPGVVIAYVSGLHPGHITFSIK